MCPEQRERGKGREWGKQQGGGSKRQGEGDSSEEERLFAGGKLAGPVIIYLFLVKKF